MLIDNCSSTEHSTLAEICQKPNSNISIITVEYDVREDIPPETGVYIMEPASNEVIKQLIESRFSNMHPHDIDVVIDFAGGNARIAIALSQAWEPGKPICGLNSSQLLARLIYQNDDPDPKLLRVAEAISLVYSFHGDYQDSSGELAVLAQIADVSERDLFTYCVELEGRGLLQVRKPYKALLPHALANRLAQDALRACPENFLLTLLMQSGNERLLRSFSHRLGYLHESPIAANIARKILTSVKDAGFPDIPDSMHELIEYIAPLVPCETMLLIESSVMLGNFKKLLGYHSCTDYTRLVTLLGYTPELFNAAAKVLTEFAQNSTNPNNNSAKNTLLDFFQLYLSGTHATPDQRLEAINQMLRSPNPNVRALGIDALGKSLICRHFTGNACCCMAFGSESRDYGLYPDRSQAIAFENALRNIALEVLNRLDMYTLISRLPRGIDTQLSKEFESDGTLLSGGESQKICLARALNKDSGLYILDEPSSALDPISEYKMNNLLREVTDKTVIFISHRLSTVVMADKIFLLENGEVLESGNHDELISRNGRYAELFKIQAKNYIRPS
ncbi:MAG: ATP-binding cassette domain-containing protein [Candidatus Pelethousia sp.]|nr:ATP-binding cassette domain-containing protein [Candidatus Pelethousia sp.]